MAFASDDLKGFYPFSLGPRSCIGWEMAWMQRKLFIARVLWTFNIIKVPGQHFDLEKTLLHYEFLAKPELRVKFVSITTERSNAV